MQSPWRRKMNTLEKALQIIRITVILIRWWKR